MRLQQLELTQFKGIELLQIPFNGKSTVMYGINGVGKSSVLTAINILFSRLIPRISRYNPALSLGDTDISYGSVFTKIKGEFLFDDNEPITYHREYDKRKDKRTHNARSLKEFSDHFCSLYLDEDSPYSNMPIFTSYGVNRSVLDVPLRIRTTHSFDNREAAFENSIQSKVDFRLFFEWFRERESFELRKMQETRSFEYKDVVLEAVRKACVSMLPGFDNMRIMHSPLRMVIDKDDVTIRIEQLSDGEKCTIALFGDLARRLSIANPNMENPLLGGGIVLIDEIELHMHPAWQRTVIDTLHTTFPNVQFIITTHSPQVLGGIPSDYNMFRLVHDGTSIQCVRTKPGYYDTNLVLEDYMGAPSVDPRVGELETELLFNIQAKQFDRARLLLSELRKMTNGTSPTITEAEILLRRGDNS